MAVAVQMPREKKDPLTTIMQGLSIAKDIYGIKLDNDKMDMLRQKTQKDAELEAFQQSGGKTEAEEKEMLMSGAIPATKDTPGAVGFQIGTPKFSEQRYVLPKSAQDAKKAEDAAIKAAEKLAEERKNTEIERAGKLRNEYDKASNDTFGALRNYKKVEAAAKNKEPTGASDMALVFAYMKTLDPGSTVREGEYATAEQARGIDSTVRGIYNKILDGQKLTPVQRQQFLQSAQDQLAAQLEVQLDTDKRFNDLANTAGVDADRVVNPVYQQLYEQFKGKQKTGGEFSVGQLINRGGKQFKYIGNDQWELVGG